MARRTSAHGIPRKGAPSLRLSPARFGHSSPQHCPSQCPPPEERETLGAPLSIRGVAALIGCSPWTVRQKYLPMGLPHFRVGSTGKLTFYKNQITRWLLAQQEKGGMT